MIVNEIKPNTIPIWKAEFLRKEHINLVLEKIKAEIAEYGSICVAYAITDKTKTDKGIEELVTDVLSEAKRQVLDIIDKYIEGSDFTPKED